MPNFELSRASPENPVRVGRYDVIGILGRGGMGMVYEAVDVDHGTPVALKTLKDIDPDTLLRFKREFRQVADLSHPNLIALYELSCADDLWFFTMEHVRGRDFVAALGDRSSFEIDPRSEARETRAETITLRESGDLSIPGELHIREPDPLDEPAIERLRDGFSQLVSAVLTLHDMGLLHLDIKPTNILMEPSGRIVLLDFGVARAIEQGLDPTDGDATEISGRRKIIGTPAWMSPEQHDGEALTPASDWYAVGLVLYAALTGVHAFQMVDGASLPYAKHHTLPPPPHERVDAPHDLSELAMRLIHPDPACRPTGEQMRAWVFEDAHGTPLPRANTTDLVGRIDERDRLEAMFETARHGGSSVVRLSGPSGVGKSALLRHLRGHAERGGALALRGRCYERETVPYKAFDAMLDDLARELSARPPPDADALVPRGIRELVRLFPVLAAVPFILRALEQLPALDVAVPATALKRRAVTALRELFAALAGHAPLLIEIDDLQWADIDSVRALTRLLASTRPPRVAVALSYRAQEASENVAVCDLLDRLDEDTTTAETIAVGPLADLDARALARAALGLAVLPDDVVEQIARTSGGVPLFVEELAHLAASAGQTSQLALEAVISRRVSALAEDQRRLVEVLSVAGNPVPVRAAVAAAGISARGIVRALWSLRRLDFIRATGANQDDTIGLRHDGLRNAIRSTLSGPRVDAIHLALGQSLADLHVWNRLERDDGDGDGGAQWLFDAARHLSAVTQPLDARWRRRTAQLNLEAGRRARSVTAFDLAYRCFDAGTRQFESDDWGEDYPLRRGLHEGAAEAAYLSARWLDVARHVEAVKRNARGVLDQLGVWETQIDAAIARQDFANAVDVGRHASRRLGIELPAAPTPADILREFGPTQAALDALGPAGVRSLPRANDPLHLAALRLQSRMTSAAYFGRPNLLPILGFRMVGASLERGIAPGTAYGLSIFGIVLNVMGMYREAHTWGTVALDVLERLDDRSLDARTGHVVHDLVCNYTVALGETLDAVWGVYQSGKTLGDIEYAAYAAHAWVHNSLYAGRELEPLFQAAVKIGDFMRGHDQVNAFHVHEPFEQLLRALTGRTPDASSLDTQAFSESASLASAQAAGSRSAMCLNRVVIGLARYTMGTPASASEVFEAARPYLDGMPSVWHTPMFHQFASLAILGLEPSARAPLRQHVAASIDTLEKLADAGPMNFAHRLALVQAEQARVDGDLDLALARGEAAVRGASDNGFAWDHGLGWEVMARCHDARGDAAAAREALIRARDVYAAWGATAKAEQLGARLDPAPN